MDSIIIDVIPFPVPENDTERNANVVALRYYEDEFARENHVAQTMYATHPDDPAKVYMVSFGWTKVGWRTYAVLMDEPTFGQFSNNTREFVMQYAEASSRRKSAELGISDSLIDKLFEGVAAGAIDQDTLDQLAAGLAQQPDCGDADCPVHGGAMPFNGAKLRAQLEDKFGLGRSN
jgi:hypothetical protein